MSAWSVILAPVRGVSPQAFCNDVNNMLHCVFSQKKFEGEYHQAQKYFQYGKGRYIIILYEKNSLMKVLPKRVSGEIGLHAV